MLPPRVSLPSFAARAHATARTHAPQGMRRTASLGQARRQRQATDDESLPISHPHLGHTASLRVFGRACDSPPPGARLQQSGRPRLSSWRYDRCLVCRRNHPILLPHHSRNRLRLDSTRYSFVPKYNCLLQHQQRQHLACTVSITLLPGPCSPSLQHRSLAR